MSKIYEIYTKEKYSHLSPLAKSVYTLIHERYTLSLKNNDFKDELGVFCCFAQKDLATILNKTDRTIRTAIKALKEVGLITIVERGCKKLAKIYLSGFGKKQEPVEIENIEVKQAFEDTFNEKANNKEAKALNELSKDNETNDIVEAIKKSSGVEYKGARIKYINKALETVIKEKKEPKIPKLSMPKRVIRQEQVPDWLQVNNDGWNKIHKQEQQSVENKSTLTDEDLAIIERMKQLQAQLLGGKNNE